MALAVDMPSAAHESKTEAFPVKAGTTTPPPMDGQRGKVDIDEEDEADAIQPAAHTLLEASPLPPVPVSAPLSASPGKRDRRKNSRRGSENSEPDPTANGDLTSLNGSRAKGGEWVDDTDAESSSSQPDDTRAAHFDFGAGGVESHLDSFGEKPLEDIPTPLTIGTKSRSPERNSGSQGIEDLVSLPSPVAKSPSGAGFDVFASSPLNKPIGEVVCEQASSVAPSLSEQPVEESLTPILSALSLKANNIEEVPSQEKVITAKEPPANGTELTEDQDEAITLSEPLANETGSVTEDQVVQPPDEMFADLSISSHDPESTLPTVDESEPSQASSPLQQAAPSPAPSPTPAIVAQVIAADNATESSDVSESSDLGSPSAFQPNSPDRSLSSVSDSSAIIELPEKSPVKEQHTAEQMFRPEVNVELPTEATSLVPTILKEASLSSSAEPSPLKVPEEGPISSGAETETSPPKARERKSTSSSTTTSPPKASPPKPSKVARSSSEVKATTGSKDSKPKDGRILGRPPAKTAKSDEGVKVKAQAPSKTSLIKPKPKTSEAPSAATSGAAKAAPLKPKVQRLVVSSASQASGRVPKAIANKSPMPAPPAPAKKDTSVSSAKQKLGTATPAPDLTSTLEPEGIKSIKKRLSSSELEATSNRLYADALESKKRKEVRKAELEESFSFAPQVNTSKRRAVPDDKNRFVALHEKAKEAIKRKEDLKQKREKPECTFKPKITAKARKLSGKTSKPRYENLYQNAQEIQMKREEKKYEIDQKAVEECSFKPKIKTMKSPTKSRPLYDAERLKQKKLALEQKKIEAELSQCTFKPKVVAKSAKAKGDEAGEKGAGEVKLFNRLYQASQKRAENLERLRHEREEQEKSIATFQPKITSSNTGKGGTKQPFHERLYNKDYMQKVTADREQKKLEDEQKFSYKPQISLVPDEIKTKQSSNTSNSPDKSIFERLYEEKDKVKEKIELSEEIKMQKEMVGCTFRPQIETSPSHPKSQPGVSIWERLLNYDKNQVIEEREKQKQQLEMQECTFKPEVKPSDYFTPKKSPSGWIFDRLAGGAVSMPSTGMKHRESERKALLVGQSKRKSVPELGAFKEQLHAASVGAIIKSSTIVLSPETSPDSSANQPRSLPSSLQSSDLKKLSRSNGEMAAKSKHFGTGKTGDAEFLPEERSGPGDVISLANNSDEQLESQSQSILDNYDLWASNLEAKMRSLA